MTAEVNIGILVREVAARVPQRPAILQGDSLLTYERLVDRSARFAGFLRSRGIGCRTERDELAGHRAGQDLLAQFLHNSPAYIEGMIGSYLARAAPFNVNYRYQQEELRYLFDDASPAVIQYHARFAPSVDVLVRGLAQPPLLVQVPDDSGEPLLPGAVDFEDAVSGPQVGDEVRPSPDDLYVIYTGGTTGMPKGVLWRQADVAVTTLGVRDRRHHREWESVAELLDALPDQPRRVMPCAPMMHGAAQWAALQTLCDAGTVVFPEQTASFDADEALGTVDRHQVSAMTIVGDAFAQPLLTMLRASQHDLSSLVVIVSGGAALHPATKNELLERIPGIRVLENIGSSESGIQGSHYSTRSTSSGTPRFSPDPTTVVVSSELTGFVTPGHDGAGWLATRGRIPLGYLGDEPKTSRSFPTINGVRVSLPGDRARLLEDGSVQLLGRDSTTINTGGEKVFGEEVEQVLKDHPQVEDALVCGRPSERWGAEVAALVVTSDDAVTEAQLVEFCRARLSRYKVPKSVRSVPCIERSAAGKPDYRWAAEQVARGAVGAGHFPEGVDR